MKIIDPLAQSFYVEPESGYFVTSVDLYFSSKDENLPLTVQLRPMQLGLPTQTIYPFSEVVVEPKDILVSADASIPTRITFDSPVYLLGGQFHALVILANSDFYNVWVSKLGGINVNSEFETESKQIIVTKQPLSGGLFKSQNAGTWNESSYEDLKFKLYRANFTENFGNVNFYNSELSLGNSQVAVLLPNSLEMSSKKIRVGLGTTIQDSNLTLGNTIIQLDSNGTGNYVGAGGSCVGNLALINSGIGYTPSLGSYTYNDISLTSVTGNGRNATMNITISNGVAVAATVSNGGLGYSLGDVVSANQIGSESLGRNLKLSISNISGINELIIDNVQGEFLTGVGKTIQYINNSGITTTLNSLYGGNVFITNGIQIENDGTHIKVNHKNHGMHASENIVRISQVSSDVNPSKLLTNYSSSSTDNIQIESSSNFSTFENVGVGTTNPGYILIGEEIISYSGVSNNSLTGITRGIDQSLSFSYSQGTPVYKYELNGISLRRINTDHHLEDASVSNPIDLDFYTIKLDLSSNGKTEDLPYGQVDRSLGSNFPKLYSNITKSTGGSIIKSSQNIQFEIVNPNVQTLILNGTNITSKVRTVAGTSVNGNEISFVDLGFSDIQLNSNNYFTSPRIVCSKVNEENRLTSFPGNKSLTMTLNLTTSNPLLSPMVDLDRVSMIFTTNRINNPVEDFALDNRVSSLIDDPSSFVYATNPIKLEVSATSLKVLVAAYVNNFSDIRMFYAIQNDPNDSLNYYPFPGYNNLIESGQIIDESLSDGTSDQKIEKTDILSVDNDSTIFKDYEFTKDNLPSFRYFSIKIIGSSTNQAYPPRLKDLRVIALA